MNISSLYGSLASSASQGIAPVNQPNTSRMSSIPPANGAAATANISAGGQFFSQLQELSQQDPTQFKAVAAQLATSFQNAANGASGPQAQFLTSLASTFSQAAQTGSLQPADGSQSGQASQSGPSAQAGRAGTSVGAPHHHHHHHGGGGESIAQSSSVQQAFQSALSILNQASATTPGTTTSTSA